MISQITKETISCVYVTHYMRTTSQVQADDSYLPQGGVIGPDAGAIGDSVLSSSSDDDGDSTPFSVQHSNMLEVAPLAGRITVYEMLQLSDKANIQSI